MEQSNSQFTQPQAAAQTSSQPEARIFTMPERYRHGAEGKLHEPEKKISAPQQILVKAPPAPVSPPSTPKTMSASKKRSTTKIILIVGLSVLAILGIGGYFLLRSVNVAPQTKPIITTTPVSTPEPVVQPAPISEPEEETQATTEPFPTQASPGVDTDSDGLTDTEETRIYQTDPRLPDTDKDGFLDGNEVYHGYNPAGGAPGTLLESQLVVRKFGEAGEAYVGGQTWQVEYGFHYPSVWNIQEKEEGFVLDTGTGEGFHIMLEPKDASAALMVWLGERDLVFGITKQKLSFAQSQDQMVSYIDLGPSVMRIEYDTGIKFRVDYLQTLQMIINSLYTQKVFDEQGTQEGV
jgi:uncharacterized membrane protein